MSSHPERTLRSSCARGDLAIAAARSPLRWRPRHDPPRSPTSPPSTGTSPRPSATGTSTGLAIAVVKDDSLVFARGYGVQDMRKKTPVNEHTRFAIGSTTKAMTSAALGMLVDEGKLHCDDRVIDILPDFRLYDPYATRETTIRDLLTHRTGLPGTDLFWAREPFTMQEMIHRLRYVKPATSFRSTMEYQNVTYAIGGAIIEKVSGMPWDAFIRKRIFAPLGMSETEPLVAGIVGGSNVATPHAPSGDTAIVVPIRTTDAIAPAGSVWSSVSDMSKWMRFILDSGRVGSKRLLKPETFTELVTPQIRAPMSLYPALSLSRPHGFSYGLGWFIQDYQGETVWMHTGSIDGMSAIIGLLPDRNVGVYVLANLDHAELRHALMYRVLDLYAGNPARDWSDELHALFAHPPPVRACERCGARDRSVGAVAPTRAIRRHLRRFRVRCRRRQVRRWRAAARVSATRTLGRSSPCSPTRSARAPAMTNESLVRDRRSRKCDRRSSRSASRSTGCVSQKLIRRSL